MSEITLRINSEEVSGVANYYHRRAREEVPAFAEAKREKEELVATGGTSE